MDLMDLKGFREQIFLKENKRIYERSNNFFKFLAE